MHGRCPPDIFMHVYMLRPMDKICRLAHWLADCPTGSPFYPFSVSIRTYLERSQRSTQEPKRDPSRPEGTARTSQATDQRPAVRSQTPALR